MSPDHPPVSLFSSRHSHGGGKRPRLACLRYAFLLLLLLYPATWIYKRHFWRRALRPKEVEAMCSARLQQAGLDLAQAQPETLAGMQQYALDRRKTYENMGAGILSKGMHVGGIITQGLKQEDLFRFVATRNDMTLVKPVLHRLDVPVRAMVLPMTDLQAAASIRAVADKELRQLFAPETIWAQDDHIYHATVYHASSHTNPVKASQQEVEHEEQVIRAVASQFCPIQAVLERVIATSSGVVVACWQVLPAGGEPAVLRQALGAALPNAPPKEGQMVHEPAILHTTVARLLAPLRDPSGQEVAPAADVLVQAAERMTVELCGTRTTFDTMWFVEEKDLLALALRGEYDVHPCPFQCKTL